MKFHEIVRLSSHGFMLWREVQFLSEARLNRTKCTMPGVLEKKIVAGAKEVSGVKCSAFEQAGWHESVG